MSQSRSPSPAPVRAVKPPFSHENLRASLASHALDDLHLQPADLADLRRAADGEITMEELLALGDQRYGKRQAQA